MILHWLFLGLLSTRLLASPIERCGSASTDREMLDSFEFNLASNEKCSPLDEELPEDVEMHVVSPADALSEEETPESKDMFLEYLDSLPGASLPEIDPFFQDESSYFPFMTEMDQNCLRVSLIKETFFRTDLFIPPRFRFGNSVIYVNHNWPQISADPVEMSSLSFQAYRIFCSLVMSKSAQKLAVLFKHGLIDLTRPFYNSKERAYYSIPSFWIYYLDPTLEVLQMIIAATARTTPATFNAHSGNGFTAIHSAILKKNNKLLPVLVAAGADVNIVYGNFGTAAIHAIMNRNADAIEYLARLGTTDLTLTTSNNLDIFDVILDFRSLRGLDVIIKAHSPYPINRMLQFFQKAFNTDSEFALHCLARLITHDKFKVLLAALYPIIIEKGRFDICKAFVAAGIPPNLSYSDASGKITTPLHIASMFGHLDIANFLIGLGHSPEAVDSMQLLPIELAAAQGHTSIVNAFVQITGTAHLERALIAAIRGNQVEVALYIILNMGNLDHMRIDEMTLWQWAYENVKYGMFKALLSALNFDPAYETADVKPLSHLDYFTKPHYRILVKSYIEKYMKLYGKTGEK